MIRRPPRSTRTDTLFPYTTLFRSAKLSPLRLSSRPSDRRFPLLEERAPGTVVGPGARRRHRPLYLFSSSHAGKVRAGEDPSLPARPRGCEKGNEVCAFAGIFDAGIAHARSEEHTSELQSLMRISYAVFCLNTKKQYTRLR